MFEIVFAIIIGNILKVNNAYQAPADLAQVSPATGTTANVFQPAYNSDLSPIANSQAAWVIPDFNPIKLEDIQFSSQVTTSAVDTVPSAPGTTRNIFQPSDKSDVSQIAGNETPWVDPDLIPIILEFRNNALGGLQTIPKVKAIWNFEIDSDTSRAQFFTVVNDYLSNINYPAPSALANIVSKSASLFDSLSIKVFANAVVISIAEFLLSRNIVPGPSHVQGYLNCITVAFESADLSSAWSILFAFMAGYGNFLGSVVININDEINQAIELFASELVVLHDM